MIIAIGYRVKSSVATSFRKWANDVIEEFMKKGFVLDEFLKFEGADILEGPGKISHKLAEQKALKEYEKYDLARQNQIEKEIDSKLLDILKDSK